MLNTSFVSVIIPTYNNKDVLKKTLESLCRQLYPKDKYEIIIIDDGSTDDTKKIIEEHQIKCNCDLEYFFQQNKGPSSARNFGISKARGSIIAFIDSDCIATNTWVEEITKGYDNDRVAGVGGMTKAMPTNSKISQYCAYIKMNEMPKINKNGIVYLITGNASFRKDCLEEVKGFDERYAFPGGEDPDLCYRLRQKGYMFQFNRNAVVYNPHKKSLKDLIRTYFNYGKGESFLMLRRLSNWDLVSITGVKWFIYFLKTILKMILMFIANLKVLFRFIKIPFSALSYYSKGLNINDSYAYAFLDYAKVLSFVQGCFFGYIIGKFKGFKKNNN